MWCARCGISVLGNLVEGIGRWQRYLGVLLELLVIILEGKRGGIR